VTHPPVAVDESAPVSARPTLTGPDLDAAATTIMALPRSTTVLLMCHVNPDGDALGSMLGFGLGLRRLGFADVRASFPEPFEVVDAFSFLPGLDLLVPPHEAPGAPDLAVSFDAASPSRLGGLAERLSAARVSVVLDHHASNPGFGSLQVIDPAAAATALVAARLLDRLGVAYDREIATCLYVGLVTDTGSFKFDLTTSEVHALAARLIAAGVSPSEVSRRVFDTRPFEALRLLGDVLSGAVLDPDAAGGRGLLCAHATLADLERHGQPAHVLESFIDVVRTAAEADVTCLAKPVGPGEWTVSMRSKGHSDVAAVAVALGGGGHRLAAGFSWQGELAGLFRAVRDELAGSNSGTVAPVDQG
jgi:phosphoesterase RecJ-like protein